MRKYNRNELKYFQKYNCRLRNISDIFKIEDPLITLLEISEETIRHMHFEQEILYVIKGNGKVVSDKNTLHISDGDIISIDNLEKHKIINSSKKTMLHIHSIVPTNLNKENYQNKKLNNLDANYYSKKSTELIISTPPTPNGNLHLGHLGGPYLRADIFRRIKSLEGVEAIHITGSDDYQSYIPFFVKNKNTESFLNSNNFQINDSLKRMSINLHSYSKPSEDPYYSSNIQKIFKVLFDKGFIIKREDSLLFL